MWKNTVEPGRTQMTILRKPIISCVTQATDTLSEYVKINTFPLQLPMRESASLFTFTSFGCLVVINITSVHMKLMMNSRGIHHIALI